MPVVKTHSMKIKVVGIGDTGCRIVNKMIREQIPDIEFIAINSEAQPQGFNELAIRIPIGWEDGIEDLFRDTDMVLLLAGMGDCTSHTTELVAEIARESGVLTIAIVTTPFSFKGNDQSKMAEERIKRLLCEVDSLFIIHNDRLVHVNDHKISVGSALWVSDQVVRQSVRAIAEVITVNGLIQLDFNDVISVMRDAGPAWVSFGRGIGRNRSPEAVKMALSSPLIDACIGSTKGVLFKILGSANLTLYEVNQAAEVIKQAVDPEANILFGIATDPTLENEFKVTLVGTGFTNI